MNPTTSTTPSNEGSFAESADELLNVTVLFERLGPYHAARLNAAADRCRLTAIEVQRTDEIYAWDELDKVSFARVSIYESSAQRSGLRDLKRRMEACLAASKPDAVAIHGWSEPAALLALRWCRANQVPAIVMSESSERDAPRGRAGEWVKGHVVSQFSAGLVGGRDHRDYLVKLGIPEDSCFLGYDVVDNAYFQNAAAAARNAAETIRSDLGLPRSYFLASCRFIEKKNVERMIETYAQYRRVCGEDAWDLVILGDGPLRDRIEAKIASLQLSAHVHLPGFRQYAELPRYYALAGAFVHASTVEQWGLVVNEAMACGLPVIVSDRCGCARELVHETNGWAFDPHDVNQLADCFIAASGLPEEQMAKMKNESRQIISEWSPELFAYGLMRAARSAMQHDRGRWSKVDDQWLMVLAWKRRNQRKSQVNA